MALKIQFSRSGKTLAWHADAGSLLEMAEKNEPGAAVEAGSCLTCIAVPKTTVTLDA